MAGNTTCNRIKLLSAHVLVGEKSGEKGVRLQAASHFVPILKRLIGEIKRFPPR